MAAVKTMALAFLIIFVLISAAIGTFVYTSGINPSQNSLNGNNPTITPQPTPNNQETANQEVKPTPTVTAKPQAQPTSKPDSSSHSSASPTPAPTPAPPDFDSGWVNITDKAGSNFTIPHHLGTQKITVSVTGKTAEADQEHQWELGSSDILSGFNCSYGGSGNDCANAVVNTPDGGYVVFGYTSIDQGGSWLIKVDAAGVIEWNHTFSGSYLGIGESLVRTPDGGYALLLDAIKYGTNNFDIWLIKTDANGEPQWNQTYGDIKDDQAVEIILCSDGGYAIVGNTISPQTGKNDILLIKTDQYGNALWNRTFGGNQTEQANSLILTREGGFAIAGMANPYGSNSNNTYEQFHYWLIKTDALGNKQWDKVYGGPGNEFVGSVVQTADGGYALGGRSATLLNDIWLVKTDVDGNMLWNKSYGGIYYDDVRAMILTREGGFAFTGVTYASNSALDNHMYVLTTDSTGNLEKFQVFMGTYSGEAIIENDDGSYVVAGGVWSSSGDKLDVLLLKTYLQSGLALTSVTDSGVTFYRDISDIAWNYLRIKITIIR